MVTTRFMTVAILYLSISNKIFNLCYNLIRFCISLYIRIKTMASFVSSIRADKNLENSGVWVSYTDKPNDDGTVPEFKIKRVSITNTAYQAKINPILKRIENLNASKNDDNIISEVVSLNIELIRVYLDEMLVDWRNVKDDVYDPKTGERVYDNDGRLMFEEIPYSKEMARELLANADAINDAKWLMEQSGNISNFLTSNRKANLKH